MTKRERKRRILAVGETMEHCHVVTGKIEFDSNGRIIVGEDSNAILRHLIEKDWMNGVETWTGEHKDIRLKPGIYEPVLQKVFDPLTQRIERLKE
jgi:hypothetical protein